MMVQDCCGGHERGYDFTRGGEEDGGIWESKSFVAKCEP